MTSATANNKRKVSKALHELEVATGKVRIYLDDLHPRELQALLEKEINGLDMKDLRGFRELKDTLSRRGDSPLSVNKDHVLVCHESLVDSFNIKSYTVRVCRGVLSQKLTFRHKETGAEIEDWKTAREWGNNGYLIRCKESLLLLRRVQKYSDLDELLVEVTYNYVKVTGRDEYLINEISVKPIPVSTFCKYFGEKAPEIACNLLWELSSIYRQTADEMESDARRIRKYSDERERLAESIGYLRINQ